MSQSSPDVVEQPKPIPPPNPVYSGVPVWATVLISLVCLVLGLAVSLVVATSRKPETAAPQGLSTAGAEPKPRTPTQLELAEQGNPQAVEALEKIEPADRTIEQAVAMSRGQAAEKRLALVHLRSTIDKLGGMPNAEVIKRIVQFARDGETAREVFGLLATLPGPLGPDLLYEFSSDKKTQPGLVKYAEQLLVNKQVRPKASPALSVLLDLRDATTCEQRKAILEKATEVGDRRMLMAAAGLAKKTGCGEHQRDDCNPCLREKNSKLLHDALVKIQKRKPPSY
jgi:hypothetical protein